MDSEPDHVGRILEQWRVERPDLDISPMGVIGRLHRLADRLHAELRPVFAEAGLGDGDFDVLASLRRSGAPYELTPGELGASTMVTSGAVTKRVDRLEAAGYVERRVCADDGRSRRVRLTAEGRALVDDVLDRHVANEHRLLSGLSDLERSRLARLLETWGRALDE
ncbi:MarR family winged helix-turn-helix transcriptional regulator [Nocardioides rubriscoriae]|uniref:MarR family winged helix-turn-helix transcriptional regulator n=1 Tax=Nocardioides rubriscoriae TaxID=642762 RepID=UPI0011DFA308|nr:MarR family transcriptional regulator [Nocardioides rubriscoriae]